MLIDQRLNHELTLAGSYLKKEGYLTKKEKKNFGWIMDEWIMVKINPYDGHDG